MPKKKAATKRKATPRKMSAREHLFVAEYLKDLNAAQAAIRAGYSAKTARQQGHRLLTKADIAEAVAKAVETRSAEVKTDADWLLARFRAESDADIGDLYYDDNTLKPVKEWPKIWRQGLVVGLEVEQMFEGTGDQRTQVGIITKIKHSDRAKRLEMLGRHVNVQAFKDRVIVDVSDPLKQLLEQVAGNSIRPKDTSA